MVTSYADFLARKQATAPEFGRSVEPSSVHPMLHTWQREIVAWAVRTGRAAVWADTGLGKTVMQLEWARLSIEPGVAGNALIVAPLAVCQQTVREAAKLGITARYARDGDQVDQPGIWVTNYEMVEHFDPSLFDSVVLDEASILKNSDGKTRTRLIQHFAQVPARLACTATPAPNDPEELTNQAEFLGRSTRVNMLAAYFIHDADGWRMKGHARAPMFKWMSSWALAIRRPSDMGYADDGYQLPGLDIVPHLLPVDLVPEGQLFATDLGGVGGRAKVRRETLTARCEGAADLVAADPDEPWLIWCGLNDEADLLAKLIPDAVNVHGAWSPDEKADALLGFADGKIRRLITKPSIAAFGLNWQHCARMAFVGLSDSYETYYQSIRRCYRYGQTRIVQAHIILSELESQIAANVARKERDASAVTGALVEEMQRNRARGAAA
ncbi:SNF2-related protein [Streptomyces kaempferi]|uniref:SNF2-related protein n=1 Tax=Streptomyces kaempferi TaxID=333725 RepID=A0ABW3XDT0_9ACTN